MTEVEHIIDYLVSDARPPRIRKMSFQQAKISAHKWSLAQQKKGSKLEDDVDDLEVLHDFLDGTKIVKLKTKKAFQREGFLMHHCVGGYSVSDSVDIYSYRDSKNMPHATFEVQKNSGEMVQIKGKGNGPIHPKYIYKILAFLDGIKFKIRPSDMKNLGYYHIEKDILSIAKQITGVRDGEIVVIHGEHYAVDLRR